ncbi:MAG: MFS transporter, partial [Peptostreptococcaceae bacterium]
MKDYKKVKWSMWTLIAVSMLLAMFLRLSTSVITDNLENELGFTRLQISNISTITLYSYAFLQIPAGLMIDKYGSKKVTGFGIIVAGVGSFMFGMVNNLYVAYLSRMLIGAGTAGILLSSMKIQVNWFNEEEFTNLTSKMALIASIGGLCATFPLVILNDFWGWRNTFLLIGVIAVVQGIIILIKLKDTPKEYGFDVTKEVKIEKISVIEGLKSVL